MLSFKHDPRTDNLRTKLVILKNVFERKSKLGLEFYKDENENYTQMGHSTMHVL